MAQDVSPVRLAPNPGALDRAADHVAQTDGADGPERGLRREEDVVRGNGRALRLQVVEDGVACVLRKRQPGLASSLPKDAQSRLPPVDVAEPQAHNLMPPKAEACEQQ